MTPHPSQPWKPEWLGQPGTWLRTPWTRWATDAVKTPGHPSGCTSRNEIDPLFDGIAYGKTAAVLPHA